MSRRPRLGKPAIEPIDDENHVDYIPPFLRRRPIPYELADPTEPKPNPDVEKPRRKRPRLSRRLGVDREGDVTC
jgi:hypothetical protein